MDELLITFGGAVKAAGNGRLEGLLVPFGNPEQLDLDGEFFDAGTDFDREFPTKVSTYYDHGMDEKLGRKRLTRAAVKADEAGVWLEDQLDLSQKYHQMIYSLAEQGKLFLSSGAASHLVEKERAEKGVRITQWPLAEASYTVHPANPNATVQALKHYSPTSLEEALSGKAAPTAPLSLPERTEAWLDAGDGWAAQAEDLLAAYSQIREAEVKAGREAWSSARKARLAAMEETFSKALAQIQRLSLLSSRDGAAVAAGMGAELEDAMKALALEQDRLRLRARALVLSGHH